MKKEIWVILLEKAWAKINGGYLNIIYGCPREAFEALTEFGSIIYYTLHLDYENKNLVQKEIENAYETNTFLYCATIPEERVRKEGLIESHAYSMLSVKKINFYGNIVILYRLRNP